MRGDVVLRVERDPGFWEQIASHPALAGLLYGLPARQLAEFAAFPSVLPLAAEHGGFLCVNVGGAGLVVEFHTIFTPEGWGREAALAARATARRLFAEGARLLVTYEQPENARSRPPRSFGFVAVGDWSDTPLGKLRLWTLSHDAWLASPVCRRGA